MAMDSLFLFALLIAPEGTVEAAQAHVPGASLTVEFSEPLPTATANDIVGWIESAASNVSRVYGRFPNPDAKVIVTPSASRRWGDDSAVYFGRVTRFDGEKVELFVNPERPMDEFYSDWTATHEFSHLMLPLLNQKYRWITEGFATYYQNVLMARGGHYTNEFAWQRLTEGFERGRNSRPDLSPNEATTTRARDATMKIYWSGAALALIADVDLRSRSGGTESLNSVLDKLQDCCLPARRLWSGPKLFRKLDALLDDPERPVFMPLYRQIADDEDFPDIAILLNDLGVTPGPQPGAPARLNASARLSALRASIMQP